MDGRDDDVDIMCTIYETTNNSGPRDCSRAARLCSKAWARTFGWYFRVLNSANLFKVDDAKLLKRYCDALGSYLGLACVQSIR